MNKSLYTQRKDIYQRLEKLGIKYQAQKAQYIRQRRALQREIEDLQDEISKEQGIRLLANTTHIDNDHLARFLKDTYAGSHALALVSASLVRKEYEKVVGKRVSPALFARSMDTLGFENKIKRVVTGGGYVARVWVRKDYTKM